jgi:GNAT superfamily N-acetyltransferase
MCHHPTWLDPGARLLNVMERTVTARPVRPDDADRLLRLHGRLSPATIYRRFFSPVMRPSPTMLRHLATVDHDNREALVAVVADEIVGVARYDRVAGDPSRAEVAVVVEDAWQHHGVAHWLLLSLAALARARGIEAFTATVLADNDEVLGLIRSMNRQARMTTSSGESDVLLPLTG